MPIFKYEALDSHGTALKNNVEALTQAEAVSKIRNLGYYPVNIAPEPRGRKTIAQTDSQSRHKRIDAKVKIKVITEFARELSTLQEAGLPILGSLRSLEEQEKNMNFRKILCSIADDIEGGETLSDAMAKHPRCFDRLFIGMVAAGEKGGILEMILTRVADFMEKSQKIKSRVKGAMIYPIVVLSAAFTMLLLLMIFIIPKFEVVLREMLGEGQMPVVTQTVLRVAQWIANDYGWAILIGVPFAFIFLTRLARRFRVGRYVLDSIKIRMPVMGQLTRKVAVTRWTRTLGTLIGAGVPILDAINVTSETAGNEVFSRMLINVQNSIRQGDTFATPLKQSKTVDLIVSNMVAVGEETGDLDKMLLKIADNYDEQVDVLVASLMHLLEPIMIVGLGGIVLVIVMSVFAPMVKIITTLEVG